MTALLPYRDDGPLARSIGRTLGRALRVDELPLTLLGALALVATLATAGRPPSAGVVAGVAAFVLLAGAASTREQAGALTWLAPPLLRAIEYSFLIALTVLAGPDAMPVCFAFVTVLALHHYETAYRLRHQRLAPPAWLTAIGGGWDGRMLVASLLPLAGILDAGLFVGAVALGLVYAVESTVSWLRYGRERHAPDEEPVAGEDMLAE